MLKILKHVPSFARHSLKAAELSMGRLIDLLDPFDVRFFLRKYCVKTPSNITPTVTDTAAIC